MTSVCTFSLDRAQTLELKHEKIKDENRQEYILKEEYILKLYAKWTEAQSGRSN
ncbi:hypothetical protein ACE6H2_000676 [Prunus campanulata]